MRPLARIEADIEALAGSDAPASAVADAALALSEEMLEHWVAGRGLAPTTDKREGFRLLALHRQGAQGEPSFNACRETCRELAYHVNLLIMQPDHPETDQRRRMIAHLAMHLFLFISGKMAEQEIGEFCCSSRPLHTSAEDGLAERHQAE
jgi:hypothetical protein